MDGPELPIIFFPGLGADARMYSNIWRLDKYLNNQDYSTTSWSNSGQVSAFPRLQVVDWSACTVGGSIDEFASRLAATLDVDGPVIIGGSSFGGFVAWELAKHVDARALILLGSASTPRAVRQPLRFLLPAARFVPSAAHSLMKFAAPVVAPAFGAPMPAQRRLFTAMMRSTPTAFMTWAGRAVATWTPAEVTGIPVHRLHGRRDRIIAPPHETGACIIEEAGHLPTVTHPDEVNRFLARVLPCEKA